MHHLALLDRGDEARVLLFAETHQHAALLRHVAHRQPALAPVTPRLGSERRQPRLRRDLADALEILRQHALLDGDLRRRVEMLQRTAAALRKMPAQRLDPVRRSDDHLDHVGFVEMAMALAQLRDHRLAEQGAADEDRLAVNPGHAAAIVAEVGDVGFERLWRNGVGSGHERGRWRLAADYHRSAGFTPRDAARRPWFSRRYFFCQAPAASW